MACRCCRLVDGTVALPLCPRLRLGASCTVARGGERSFNTTECHTSFKKSLKILKMLHNFIIRFDSLFFDVFCMSTYLGLVNH